MVFKFIAVILISLLLFFVIGEIYLRNFTHYGIEYYRQMRFPAEEVKICSRSEFSELPWITADIIESHKKLIQDVDTEKQRNPSRPSYRIIILGDSIAAGGGLFDHEKTSPSLLNTLLQRDYPDINFKTIVFAAGGYSTSEEVACYERYCKPFKPDLVIVAYCQNDTAEAYPKIYKKDGKCFMAFYKTSVSYLTNIPFNRFLTERFLLMRLVNESLIKVIYQNRQLPNIGYCLLSDERIHRAFKKLSSLTRADNVPVIVVVFPYLEEQLDISKSRMAELIKKWCGEFNFLHIDLLEAYKEYPPEALKYKPEDICHPNAMGHRIAAQVIAEKIKKDILGEGSSLTAAPNKE